MSDDLTQSLGVIASFAQVATGVGAIFVAWRANRAAADASRLAHGIVFDQRILERSEHLLAASEEVREQYLALLRGFNDASEKQTAYGRWIAGRENIEREAALLAEIFPEFRAVLGSWRDVMDVEAATVVDEAPAAAAPEARVRATAEYAEAHRLFVNTVAREIRQLRRRPESVVGASA